MEWPLAILGALHKCRNLHFKYPALSERPLARCPVLDAGSTLPVILVSPSLSFSLDWDGDGGAMPRAE
jgi:hypothetical protein